MRNKTSATLLPACAFVIAVVLSCLANTRMAALGRAQAAPTCMVSAAVTGWAGSATTWTITLTSLQINSSNNKKAHLAGKTTANVDINMSGTDSNGAGFSFPNLTTTITFTPNISKNYAPGTRTESFAPLSCTSTDIFNAGKATAKAKLAPVTVRKWKPPTWPAQTVEIQVNGTFKCTADANSAVGIGNGLTLKLAATATGDAPATTAGTP